MAKLFWVETEDHDEDWFVVARSAAAACEFFEAYEGYDHGDATAFVVLEQIEVAAETPEHPSLDDLRAWGGEVLGSNPCAVRFGNRIHLEGSLETWLQVLDRERARDLLELARSLR